jgi:hypothetical protein
MARHGDGFYLRGQTWYLDCRLKNTAAWNNSLIHGSPMNPMNAANPRNPTSPMNRGSYVVPVQLVRLLT